jgi:asparagine synthase (glutamine-hydrolysing)
VCGLTGFWKSSAAPDSVLAECVERMATTLTHRGPDDAGTWVDGAAGIAFGFRRLAIIDLSPTGHQPMVSIDGRYVVIFNGEIYNYRDLRKELENGGRTLRGQSDTEVVLEACAEWGIDAALGRFVGMFAFAVWDREHRELTLCRDRLGKKPLYYTKVGTTFVFGSELKALCAYPGFRGTVDRDALALYLRFSYVPAPHSIYAGVCKLPPGHVAVVRQGGEPEIRCYWDARDIVRGALENRLAISDAEAVDSLDDLLRTATACRMIADVPLGAFLSGGVDSSTIVALMQAQNSRPVKTFSIGFYNEGYNEAEDAKAVARHLGTDHTELYVTPEEALDVIPCLPDVYDEPFADSSQIPTLLVSRLARRKVTVALSGDGGDELFAGYTRYAWAEQIWRTSQLLPAAVRRLAADSIQRVSPTRWDALYGAVEPTLPSKWRQMLPGDKLHKLAALLVLDSPDAIYQRLVSSWHQPFQAVLGARERGAPLDSALDLNISNSTERMMFTDLVTYLVNDILVKVDRASMAVSLEVRGPMLDHRVVEWAWRLPLNLKRRAGHSKWVLRQVLHRYVPPELVKRPKSGFGVPIDVWLRGPLREWAEGLLDGRRLEHDGYFRPELVRQVWRQHLSGHYNLHHQLWPILMFQAWKQRWLPQS